MLAVFVLALGVHAQRAASSETRCFNAGDSVKITGKLVRGTLLELTAFPERQYCANYYEGPYSLGPWHPLQFVSLVQSPAGLPYNEWLEVSGVLEIPPNSGIRLVVTAIRNVDADVKERIADWIRACREWQDENLPPSIERRGDGRPFLLHRIPQEDGRIDGSTCGLETITRDATGKPKFLRIMRPKGERP